MTTRRDRGNPDRAELLFGVVPWIAGAAVAAPMFPGFLLCLPGLVFAGLLLIPVVAVALAVAIAALPVLLVRRLVARAGRPRPRS
jgi:hypothetical protein